MKRTSIITATLLTGMLAIGAVGQASAAGSGGFTLENGSTPSRMIPNVAHYRFDVDDARHLRVISEQWSAEGPTRKLRATLRDAQGRVVAHSRGNGHDFVLEHRLQPGSYILEVRSSRLSGGWNRGTQRYRLVTHL